MLKNGKGLLIFFLFMLLFLTACSSKLTNEEIQAKMILANQDLSSFFVETKISQAITFEGENFTSTVKNLVLNGDVDLKNQNGFLNVQMKLQEDDGLGVTEKEIATLYYVLGNNMFFEVRNEFTDENVWVREEFDEDLWEQQVQVNHISTFLGSGSVEQVDEEDDYRVIKVKPSDNALASFVKKEYKEFLLEDDDPRAAIESYDLTVWINKESFLIERGKSELKMILTSKNSLLPEGVGATITAQMENSLSELGKNVELDVPEEALETQSLEAFKTEILEKSSKDIEAVNAELERIKSEREQMVQQIEDKKPDSITRNTVPSVSPSSETVE